MTQPTPSIQTVRDTIDRDLSDEPQSVVSVSEVGKLRTDLNEYVLTDHLARDFATMLEPIVAAARPPGQQTKDVGIWVSGFFGSGKSHFAKVAGHLLANTPLGGAGAETSQTAFKRLLSPGVIGDDQVAELLHQFQNYQLDFHLVAFDIQAFHSANADKNVGLTFLRAFYSSLDVSNVAAFAEQEIDLMQRGKHDEFLTRYEERFGHPWSEDRDTTMYSVEFAECLAEVNPERFSSPELALQGLEFALSEYANLNIDGVVDRLQQWLSRQRTPSEGPKRLIFVADEVGAWAGRDLNRIEQVRGFVQRLGEEAQGLIWLLVTSQEKLSDVVQNAPGQDQRSAQELLQRLEARFRTNVHLESSEVGKVIEQRILRKRPTARQSLESLWSTHQGQLSDIAEPPGLELNANYPRPDRERFVNDYPFLPYQIPAASDIFGTMRGVKISSGARSMIKVVFDATRDLASSELGAVVSWDRIFDSANQGNEFADESYLGSQGLSYIMSADSHVPDTPVQASRVVKCLWLIQRLDRIPRTPNNLARLLVNNLDINILQYVRDVEQTLTALAARNFVRQDVSTEQWHFLSQDEVTVEKIVSRISDEIKQKEIRDEIQSLYSQKLLSVFNGRITTGQSSTPFNYAVVLNDVPLRNEHAPVQLRALQSGTPISAKARDDNQSDLGLPSVFWEIDTSDRLEARLRRAMAIERLDTDDEFRRIATDRTKREAEKLRIEDVRQLRSDAQVDVDRAFRAGTVFWSGIEQEFEAGSSRGTQSDSVRSRIEEALREKIQAAYFRFDDGDRTFSASNIDKLFTASPADRAALDPDLRLFSQDGHVHGNSPVVEELSRFLLASAKTSGNDVTQHFSGIPFGWPQDLLRYAAAAMFIDGKVSAIDKSGKRHEDPRLPATRSLFTSLTTFKTTRLEVEETSLEPIEVSRARQILTDLEKSPADGTEISLRDAIGEVVTDISRRLSILEKARQVDFPLPSEYDGIETTLEDISAAGSRTKVIRAFLSHGNELINAETALAKLEEFGVHSGFEQYQRSQQLLMAALQAGLLDDPKWGSSVQKAQSEIEAIKDQRRVLDDWSTHYETIP